MHHRRHFPFKNETTPTTKLSYHQPFFNLPGTPLKLALTAYTKPFDEFGVIMEKSG